MPEIGAGSTFTGGSLTNGISWPSMAASTNMLFQSKVDGDSNWRFLFRTAGQLKWGSGSASLDCLLSRRDANILNTPDRLEVGTLGVGNSVAASVLGTVTGKVELFDDAGNSLGYLPIYDAIT